MTRFSVVCVVLASILCYTLFSLHGLPATAMYSHGRYGPWRATASDSSLDDTVQVTITASGFDPAWFTIVVGDAVIWYNDTDVAHVLRIERSYRTLLPLVAQSSAGRDRLT